MLQLTHLPEPLTSLVGREPEIHRIVDLLSRPETRHLTLVGPGGIGKTRLALRVGQSVGDDFPDGVSFIDLSPVTDHALVAASIATGLGLSLAGPEPVLETLIAHLSDRGALLILDNFEHLMPAASLVPRLAGACPDLAILVTSRERLGTSGEQVIIVEPLGLPKAAPVPQAATTAAQVSGSPAVQLFVERATGVRPEFALTNENAADVATICRRVDGMPLAIELVAARVAHLSPQAIATRVEHLLPLMAGGLDRPARLRTMSDAVRWSYELLEPEEQTLFCRLAVFAGGCTIEAATEVGVHRVEPGDGQQLGAGSADISTILRLASLVDKSLLRFNDREGAESRYTMLEPVREFGLAQLARLDQEAETRRAHAKYFLALAERLRKELREPEPGLWISHLESEQDNFRAALHWLLQQDEADVALALKMCVELAYFWLMRDRSAEGTSWLRQAVERAGNVASYEMALAFLYLGHFAHGNALEAFDYYQRSLALHRELDLPRGIAGLLSCLGMAADQMGRFAEARAFLEESLSLSEKQEDNAGIAQASYHLGILMGRMGELAKAKEYLDTARGLQEQLGHVTNVAFSIMELGRIYCLEHRLDEATDLLEWSLARLELAQIRHVQGPIHYELGEVALQRKDLSRATQEFQLALRLLREANIVGVEVADSVAGLARILLLRRMPELAIQAVASVDSWRKASGFRAAPREELNWTRQLQAARRELGNDRFNVAWEQGRRTTLLAAADLVSTVKLPAATSSPATIRRPVTEVDKLTRQELRVLCLVANGLSNQQIADALSITVRTAANHVTNILGKFRVENRTQAAAIAMRHELCPSPSPIDAGN